MNAELGASPDPGQSRGALERAFDGARGAVSAGLPAGTVGEPASPLREGRLPKGVKPSRYELKLSLDPEAGRFSGSVKISASAQKPTRRVVLHALELTIRKASVNGVALRPEQVRLDPGSETMTLELDAALKGALTLELEYEGAMNQQMRGLYQSRAKFAGREETHAFTHLEPTHARRIMPSFDEPELKARFRLTLEGPQALSLISNMPGRPVAAAPGRRAVAFAQTPRMPTYLLAVFAARLSARRERVEGAEVGVWTAPGQESQAPFAQSVARHALRSLNRYFGIKYMLPKLDLVAAADFGSGAMENWGAILFRDSALLIDDKLSSPRAKRRVAEVVSHEIVHQWFGNLVTMRWWNDLWLNEAFATWVAYKLVSSWKPEWNVWLDFEQDKRSALALDALRRTRAVSAKAVTPAEIQAMFDPLTYEKGGAILRMLENYLGERAFRAGIRDYMRRFQYKNAAADDLWASLEKASGQPVRRIARDWLNQPGFPIVAAEPIPGSRPALRLSQRRFSAHGDGSEASWAIPVVVRYRLAGDTKDRLHRTLLSERSAELRLPGRGRLLWAYPNAGETGYYRVALEGGLLEAALAHRAQLAPVERASLIGHLSARFHAAELPAERFLAALRAFKDDRERVVVEELASSVRGLYLDLVRAQDRPAFAALAAELLGAHARRLGWAPKRGESEDARLSRAAVLGALSLVAPDAALLSGAESRLKAHLADPAKTDPLLIPVILNSAAREGSPALFAEFRRRMSEAETPERRDQFMRALGEFRQPELVEEYLRMTLSDEIRAQDVFKSYVWLLAHPESQGQAWRFLQANWQALKTKLGPRGAGRIIGGLGALVDERWEREIREFFARPENRIELAQRSLEQGLEFIELGLKLKRAQSEPLSRLLAR